MLDQLLRPYHELVQRHMDILFLVALGAIMIVAIIELRFEHKRKTKTAHFGIFVFCLCTIALNLWISKYHPVTPEDYFQKCQQGEATGISCVEDVLSPYDTSVTPSRPDPLGVRPE